MTELDALAEHYAKNFALDVSPCTVQDMVGDFEPLDPTGLLDDFHKLVELADQTDDGTPLPMRAAATTIDDDGREIWTHPAHLKPEGLDSALMHAATEFHALIRAAFEASNQFAALRQLQRAMTGGQ